MVGRRCREAVHVVEQEAGDLESLAEPKGVKECPWGEAMAVQCRR